MAIVPINVELHIFLAPLSIEVFWVFSTEYYWVVLCVASWILDYELGGSGKDPEEEEVESASERTCTAWEWTNEASDSK